MQGSHAFARHLGEEDDVPEVFLDRDPDLWAVCLKFMRSARLPAAVRSDLNILDDLLGEAEFLLSDALTQACNEAIASIKDEQQTKDEEKPSARPVTLLVKKGIEYFDVKVDP